MKLTYQSPAYRHIALEGTTPASGCTITVNHTRTTCSMAVEDFYDPSKIYYVFESAACDTTPGSDVISQYLGGINSNIFGS